MGARTDSDSDTIKKLDTRYCASHRAHTDRLWGVVKVLISVLVICGAGGFGWAVSTHGDVRVGAQRITAVDKRVDEMKDDVREIKESLLLVQKLLIRALPDQ